LTGYTCIVTKPTTGNGALIGISRVYPSGDSATLAGCSSGSVWRKRGRRPTWTPARSEGIADV